MTESLFYGMMAALIAGICVILLPCLPVIIFIIGLIWLVQYYPGAAYTILVLPFILDFIYSLRMKNETETDYSE